MAHVHGAKAAASLVKPAADAGAAGMMGSAMGEMGKMTMSGASPMMGGGMGSMMGGNMGSMMGEGMGSMMEGGMGSMMGGGMGSMMNMGQGMTEAMKHSMGNPGVAKGVAAGAVASAGVAGARSTLGKIIRHPLTLIGFGIVVGYLAHKYRKEIISSTTRIGEKGKDFVLQQRENLEDIVTGQREAGEGEKPK